MPLNELYKKLVALQEFDIVKETISIINENGYFLVGLLRLQLQEGKDGNDENVKVFGRDYYSDATIFEKERHGIGLGKETEWITNYMSGKFYSQLVLSTAGTTFKIDSRVDYFDEILLRSGRVIMDLDEKHLEEFQKEILIPQLKARWLAKSQG